MTRLGLGIGLLLVLSTAFSADPRAEFEIKMSALRVSASNVQPTVERGTESMAVGYWVRRVPVLEVMSYEVRTTTSAPSSPLAASLQITVVDRSGVYATEADAKDDKRMLSQDQVVYVYELEYIYSRGRWSFSKGACDLARIASIQRGKLSAAFEPSTGACLGNRRVGAAVKSVL